MQFKKILGHCNIKENLIRTVSDNRVSHAQLFLGPSGNGALALAIAYAQYINCEQPLEKDSCGNCSSCKKYEKLVHPDLHFTFPFFIDDKKNRSEFFLEDWRKAIQKNPYLDFNTWRDQLQVDNKQANINTAEIHSIIKKLSLKAFEAKYKVLIIWLPEYLDKEGNALLKLIEEPPAHTLFILVAENQDKILKTIISRTQILKIPAYSNEEVYSYLVNKGLNEQEAEDIALLSDGSICEAEDYLAQKSDNYFDILVQWLRLCVTDNGAKLIEFSDQNLASLGRENQKSFLIYSQKILRFCILEKLGANKIVNASLKTREFIKKFSDLYSIEQLENANSAIEKRVYYIERNANSKILFLDLSLQLVLLFKYLTIRKESDIII